MNHITIIGNLTKDPEFRQTQNGKDVANFTVAVNDRFGGEKKEVTYFRCNLWGNLSKVAHYVTKGKKVAVSGSVSCRAYKANNGEPAATMEINASDVELLSPKDSTEGFTEIKSEDLPF